MPPALRTLVCGSVDDGKSTLIGRLLHDAGAIERDQLAALPRGADGAPDLSWLTDGLAAEREQGITIDVAYRHLRTARRRILLLDCPGHAQYTRNMATGAAGASHAVVLADAVQGIQTQTRRHILIARLMGITQFIFAINKMDLVGWRQARFHTLAAELAGLADGTALPVCARDGDGVVHRGTRLPWHAGPTLLEALEQAGPPPRPVSAFRMPVQWVNRFTPGRRLYAGTVAAGRIEVGGAVAVPGGQQALVAAIHGPGGAQDGAEAGEAVSLELAAHHDIGRGDVLSAAAAPVAVADQFQARLVWCADTELLPGRSYVFKLGTRTVSGSISRVHHVIDMDTGRPVPGTVLRMNDVGVVSLSLAGRTAFELFADCPPLGGFIVIDRHDNATLGAGTVELALDRAASIRWQDTDVRGPGRARLLRQRPSIIWFTGLSGAGKSTIANLVERHLHAEGRHTYLLDGDNLRHGLCRDLGFSAADRVENVRRVAEVAALMADAGLIVLVCLISPFRADRQAARERAAPHAFIEVFVDAPVAECRRRDPKGLYEKAISGAIPNFTGISAPYEAPSAPDLHIRSDQTAPGQAADAVLQAVRAWLPHDSEGTSP